ncbi:DUF4166 domain-containing protein [Aestuariibius sp. 2305UL40-4]|uniref:DUF4166 domain-containing protein n=1 Tax=Aestuariibius violaceus TaxID=3234132 RepID=UPI00345EA3A1
MKVVILGGAGVFGSRLAELLVRDGHDVWIAGRNLSRARAVAARLGAEAIVLHRSPDLSPLDGLGVEVLVDAAGPFRVEEGFSVAEACIAAGIHYLDLSDDPEFCSGISRLNDDAVARGVCVLSGMSSTPALTSAAAAYLAEPMDAVDAIESAILPGNRAPRGRAVFESILDRVGRPFESRIDGAGVTLRGWSRPKGYRLPGGIRREGWMVPVPDQVLFPGFFKARSVTFRAGLELSVMNRFLAVLSRLGPLRLPRWVFDGLMVVAKALAPFGTDRGGMSVTVTGRKEDAFITREFGLLAEAGEGPFIPAVPIRAALRAPGRLPPVAGPALAVHPLDDYLDAMSDLQVRTEVTERAPVSLIPSVLGKDIDRIPEVVAESHSVPAPRLFSGRATVTRGSGAVSRLIAAVVGFPPASEDVAVTVMKLPGATGETWIRTFGDRSFRSHLSRRNDHLSERFGPLTFDIPLTATEEGLDWPVSGGQLYGLVPLPGFLLPRSVASERVMEGTFRFDVALYAPVTGGLIVRYQGWLARV